MYVIRSRDDVRLVCERAGGGPPLVLLHGTGASAARWKTVLPLFARTFTVYALDRRGRGKSGDAADYTIEREFEDVVSLVDSIGEPVHLLGHSYGGVCAVEAARLTPNVRKLVLYEPPIPVEGVRIYDVALIERLEGMLMSGQHERVAVTFLEEVVRMPLHELKIMQASPAWPERVAAARTLPRELRSHERYRFKPELFKDANTPTLLMVGGDSPGFFKAAIEVLHSALRASRVVVLPGQQHIAMDTAPDIFVREIASFLTGADS
jgi:pimeloyl-ACP methyl ester carboxylesterase